MSSLTPIHLPSLGEGVFEATLQSWLKKPGEALEKGEGFCVVSTDKVDTEIPAPVAGYFHRSYVNEGDTLSVGAKLATVASEPITRASAAHGLGPEHDHQKTPVASTTRGAVEAASSHSFESEAALPAVFHGLYAQKSPASTALSSANAPPSVGPYQQAEAELLEGVPVQRVPLARWQRRMSERTSSSLVVSPHVTSSMDMPLCAVLRWRERYRKEHGKAPPSLTAFFLHALAQCLPKHPLFLASVDGADLLMKTQVHIGVAVASRQGGIIIPVIRHATRHDLFSLSEALTQLVGKAHTGSLRPEEVTGGTFTLTNPGMFGCKHSTAIIHQPQVAIMNVGGLSHVWEPAYEPAHLQPSDGLRGDFVASKHITGFEKKSTITFSLTFDHRILGGKEAGLLLSELKEFFARPELPALPISPQQVS